MVSWVVLQAANDLFSPMTCPLTYLFCSTALTRDQDVVLTIEAVLFAQRVSAQVGMVIKESADFLPQSEHSNFHYSHFGPVNNGP